MNMKITAKKVTITSSFTDYAEKRLSTKLDRFFGEEADAKITIAAFKDMITLELTVKYDNMIFRAEQASSDKNDALDICIDRIIRQIRKNKTKIEKHLRDTAFVQSETDFVEEQASFEVVKHKQFMLKPMKVDEAILQMNMVGHTFFMFKNAETDDVNVVYKRDDGNYAVLEPMEY